MVELESEVKLGIRVVKGKGQINLAAVSPSASKATEKVTGTNLVHREDDPREWPADLQLWLYLGYEWEI